MNPELEKIINGADRIAFFGGAGVSTESHIPDFRSAAGLFAQKQKYPPEVMLSHTFFVTHTEEFFDYYRHNMLYPDAKPNAAHLALAELARRGKDIAVITQNIDGLHQAAGSNRVYELHGSVHRNYCTECGKFFGLEFILESEGVPRCDACGGLVKPDVVLYEESLDSRTVEGAVDAISAAQVLIIGGTSLTVYPAAGLVNCFHGRHLVLINKSPTAADSAADLVIREPIGKAMEL